MLERHELGRRARRAATIAKLLYKPHGELNFRRQHWRAEHGARDRQLVAITKAIDNHRIARGAIARVPAAFVMDPTAYISTRVARDRPVLRLDARITLEEKRRRQGGEETEEKQSPMKTPRKCQTRAESV